MGGGAADAALQRVQGMKKSKGILSKDNADRTNALLHGDALKQTEGTKRYYASDGKEFFSETSRDKYEALLRGQDTRSVDEKIQDSLMHVANSNPPEIVSDTA